MRLKIRYVYKKFLIGLVSLLITFTMVINSVFFAFADTPSVAQLDPALIPIFTTVASVAVGLGIQAQNGADALNQLINNAISQIKYNEVLKATSDDTYNSPYRVVGSNGQPEKPNNNNKNGKWFAIAGASALTGAVMGEKGMIEDIADTLNGLNAFSPVSDSIGVLSADDFKTQSTSGQIALQLANISNSSVTQFDKFLHSDWWSDKDFTPDDCWFKVNVNIRDILTQNPNYPRLCVTVFKKDDNLKFVDVTNGLSYYTYTNTYGSLSYLYGSQIGVCVRFLNNDNVSLSLEKYSIVINNRNANDTDITYTSTNVGTANGLVPSYFNNFNSYPSSGQQNYAYCGYKWQHINDWGLTQNVYNSNQTIINQYPNWTNESIELLGQQIDALRIGIQNLNDPWAPTQPEIQTSPAPDAVISQLLNNWLNPENAPDPNPDPDPEPDPDPSPYPDPVPEPVPDDSYLGEFMLPSTITEKFPFSIPFDIARCLRLFNTNSREAPRWECDLHYGNNTSHIVLDLSVFNDVAALIRPIEFIAFLVGLAYATRYLIKG